jgi:uncharacterized LabA/DUF88 family protein
MLTAAAFIDAGFLFGAGSQAVFGVIRPRSELKLRAVPELLEVISSTVTAQSGLTDTHLLRTYWYDGAPAYRPHPEQLEIGGLPKVKLRLGRTTASGQKGVDGLLILDLITLAQAPKGLDLAILFSGDEDLREAVRFAQGLGVTVAVAYCGARSSVSGLLQAEADHLVLIDTADVATHLVSAGMSPSPDESQDQPVIVDPGTSAVVVPDVDEQTLSDLAADFVASEEYRVLGGIQADGKLPHVLDLRLMERLRVAAGLSPVPAGVVQRARRAVRGAASNRPS